MEQFERYVVAANTELRSEQRAYTSAFEAKDIRRCQQVLNSIMHEFDIVFRTCKAIKEF